MRPTALRTVTRTNWSYLGDIRTLEKYLQSYNMEALQGFAFGVDALKSLILTVACVERRLTVSEAVRLARLEVMVQTDHWGRVEWAHDIELHDTTARQG